MNQVDFGYPWWISYVHLPVLGVAALLLWLGMWRKWSLWYSVPVAAVCLWSAAGFGVMRFGLNANGRASLPTEGFLRSGTGRVLDIGAGTGRSSIMVLEARPKATLVATDLFAESFDQHFGHSGEPQRKLLDNLKAAGVDSRASIQTADMRKLPFEDASFDAAVSAYAMDHVNREGSQQALREAARVLKPGGDFLLMLVAKEFWGGVAFGPLMMHGGFRGEEWWRRSVEGAGFNVAEVGTHPLTLYILARRK